MISFACSHCRQPLSVKDELAGKKGKCPHCGQPVLVPQAAGIVGQSGDEKTLQPRGASAKEKTDITGLPSGQSSPLETKAPDSVSRGEVGGATAPHEWSGANKELYDFLAPPQGPDELGRLGPYRVLKVLGAGGMGVVFQAEDPMLKRVIALKAMLPALAASESARKRFLREAQTAASIEHDHIVHIYQVGEDRAVPFMAMQFLKGEPLDARLKREQKIPLAETLRIGRETALGLAAAHARGLVHRDIKPANLWLEENTGRVKILDFGLARSGQDKSHLTQSGAIIGTPAYMAPEQANAKPVDGRCDLFSLGCVLYRLCTGTLPFKGEDTLSTLMAIASETPQPPCEVNPSLPRKVSDLVMNLLAKDPDKRPASAESVAGLLAHLEKEPLVEPAKIRKHKYVCPSCRAPVAAAQPIPEGKKTKCPKCGKVGAFRPANLEEEKVLGFEVEVLDEEDDKATHEVIREKAKEPKSTIKLPKKSASSGRKSASRSSAASFPLWVPATIVGALVIATGVGFYLSSQRGRAREGSGQVTQGTGGPGSDDKNTKGQPGSDGTGSTGQPSKVLSGAWQPLFNGKDLTGWEGLNQYWKMVGNDLVGSSFPDGVKFNTFLCSARSYKDFELKFQVRLKGVNANSGVQIRSRIIDRQRFVVHGPQVDMGDGYGSYWGSLYYEGKGWMKQAPLQKVLEIRKKDDFNDFFIRCVGKHVLIQLNGLTTVDDDFADMPDDGIIAWQIHGGPPMEVIFRNIQLKELGVEKPPIVADNPPATDWQPLFNGKDLTGWEKIGPADWSIPNGILRADGNLGAQKIGWLATQRDYGDFELELEYRLAPKGNSGVFVHAWKEGALDGGQFLEIQLVDDQGLGTVGKDNGTATIFRVLSPKPVVQSIPNTWHKLGIVSKGRRLQVSFENQQVIDTNLDAHAGSFQRFPGLQKTTGRIGLQNYGGAEFRNIRLRSASASPPPSPGFYGDISGLKLLKPEDRIDVTSVPPPPGAIALFDGTSLANWTHLNGNPAPWKLLPGGIMQAGGGDIKTKQGFDGSFKLHVEFRVPYMPKAGGQGRGNSGIYLQGRYELQVLDSYGLKSGASDCGAIYGIKAPLVNVCKAPTVWQSYDIDYKSPICNLGKKVKPAVISMIHNGVTIHDSVQIPTNATVGGQAGDPCQPGPIMLQDHGNPVQFRNIWLTIVK